MASTKKITINAASAIVQVVFTALLYFFLYKYLLTELGVEQLGVWALILSFSSIANLANFGITSGLVKFVAEYLAENKENNLGKLIFTSFSSMLVLFAAMSIIVFFSAQYFLHWVVDEQFLTIAFQILPFSLASLCLNAVSGVFTSVLEGFQKNYLRNFIYVFSGIVMFILTLFLTPIFHLKGVAIAQLAQAIFVFFVALILIYKISPANRFTQWRWSRASFKEVFNYGYKFQVVSVCQLLYEPTTKLLLSKFGGLAFVGHYEMATRLVNQFRALLVNANQVVIPVIAEKAKVRTKEELQGFYRKMNQILTLFTLPLSALLLLATPLISIIWIGDFDMEFVLSMLILLVSAVINILCGPSYFSCLAEGRLTILVTVHSLMAVLNLAAGCFLGAFFAGYGVALAWGISLSVGSIILIYNYGKKISVDYFDIFSKNDKGQFLLFLFVTFICIFAFCFTDLPKTSVGATIIVSIILLYIPFLLKNETIKHLIKEKSFK